MKTSNITMVSENQTKNDIQSGEMKANNFQRISKKKFY